MGQLRLESDAPLPRDRTVIPHPPFRGPWELQSPEQRPGAPSPDLSSVDSTELDFVPVFGRPTTPTPALGPEPWALAPGALGPGGRRQAANPAARATCFFI